MALMMRSSVNGRDPCRRRRDRMRGGDDDAVADLPAGDRLGQGDRRLSPVFARRAELDPGAAQRCAVEVHAAAAADDGRARFLVHAVDVVQADQGGVLGVDGLVRACRLPEPACGLAAVGHRHVAFAIEAVLAVFVAGLNLDEADFEPGVLVRIEADDAGNAEAAKDRFRFHVVNDAVPFPDQHPASGAGHLAAFPRGRCRPGTAGDRADDRWCRLRLCAIRQQVGRTETGAGQDEQQR